MEWLLSPAPWLWLLAVVLVFVGVAGTLLPALPGTPLVFVGLLLAAWAQDFERVSGGTVAMLAFLTAVSVLVDFAATALGVQRVGASTLAIVGATVGAVVGILFGLPGIVLGPFAGAVVGELLAQRSLGHAARAGVATWVALVVGTVARVGIVIAMLGVFAVAYFV